MINLPIGLSTGCFHETSIFDCLESVRQAGFHTIEVCSAPRHLDYHDQDAIRRARHLIEGLAVEPHSFHAPFRHDIDITSPNEGNRKRSLREVEQACAAAAELGAHYVVIHPGPESSNIPRSERMERMDFAAASLNHLIRFCEDRGVRLVLENMLPHLFTGPVRELLWILGSLETTSVGICLDTGHAFLSGDIERVVHKLSGHLWMVHASDNRGERDDHLPPGQGRIDWRKVMQQLARNHFHGSLILELAGGDSPEKVLRGARESSRLLRQIMREVSWA